MTLRPKSKRKRQLSLTCKNRSASWNAYRTDKAELLKRSLMIMSTRNRSDNYRNSLRQLETRSKIWKIKPEEMKSRL